MVTSACSRLASRSTSDHPGCRANINNPNTSDESKERSRQALGELEDSGAVGGGDSTKNKGNVSRALSPTARSRLTPCVQVIGGHKVRCVARAERGCLTDTFPGEPQEPEHFGRGQGALSQGPRRARRGGVDDAEDETRVVHCTVVRIVEMWPCIQRLQASSSIPVVDENEGKAGVLSRGRVVDKRCGNADDDAAHRETVIVF